MIAKMCGYHYNNTGNNTSTTIVPKTGGGRRGITYSFVDAYHNLCVDKKDIILGELCACKKLLDNITDDNDRVLIENEISELRMTLDLIS